MYIYKYVTPEGFTDIFMSSSGEKLNGLWFEGSRDVMKHKGSFESANLSVFVKTAEWLDIYFSGKNPSFTPDYEIPGLTPFRREVVDEMLSIPFGETVTYGDIAASVAVKHGVKRMSAQAVGGAVGWNPLCIIIPCHRVVGADGSLTGYGGGINNKAMLLKNEGCDMGRFFVPSKGTAL